MPESMDHVDVVLRGSIVLLVVTIGMRSTWHDLAYLIHRPGLLARSILARNIVMPVAAALLIQLLDVKAPLSSALIAVSIATVPPLLPRALLRANGSMPYAVSLVATQSLLAIVFVPLSLAVLNVIFGTHAQLSARDTANVVASVTIAPFLTGIVIRQLAPAVADRVARPVHTGALLLLATALVLLLPHAWRAWAVLIGNGTVLVIMLLIAIGIGAGHLLAGPREADRTTLALATVSTNPGLAIVVLEANLIQGSDLAVGAVLLYLLVQAVVTWPYQRARRTPSVVGLYRVGERRRRPRLGPDRRRVVG